jgi:hypothetical protein
MPTKKLFKKRFFCILHFEGTFTSFSKGQKSKRSHKTVEIKVFLLFLLNDRRIRIRIQEAQKHVDLVDPDSDPDPRHCSWDAIMPSLIIVDAEDCNVMPIHVR